MSKMTAFIITYNRLSMLKLTLKSILEQTYNEFEICILDNCSDDGTQSYIQELDNPKIRYVRHDKNLGGAGNTNYAFEHCQTEYFAVFHDDDILHSDLIEKEISYMDKHPGCTAVSCLANNINEKGERTRTIDAAKYQGRVYKGNEFFKEYLHHQATFTFPATIYRTSFFKTTGIKIVKEAGPCADVVLYMDIERNGGTLSEIPQVLIDYRIYTEQDSSLHLESMLIDLMRYLCSNEYYNKLLQNDQTGKKRYFKWFARRLMVRVASKHINGEQAINYLKEMQKVLQCSDGVYTALTILIHIEKRMPHITQGTYNLVKRNRMKR